MRKEQKAGSVEVKKRGENKRFRKRTTYSRFVAKF